MGVTLPSLIVGGGGQITDFFDFQGQNYLLRKLKKACKEFSNKNTRNIQKLRKFEESFSTKIGRNLKKV